MLQMSQSLPFLGPSGIPQLFHTLAPSHRGLGSKVPVHGSKRDGVAINGGALHAPRRPNGLPGADALWSSTRFLPFCCRFWHSFKKRGGRLHPWGILSSRRVPLVFSLSSTWPQRDCLAPAPPSSRWNRTLPLLSSQRIVEGGGAKEGPPPVNDSAQSHEWRISPGAPPTVSIGCYHRFQENKVPGGQVFDGQIETNSTIYDRGQVRSRFHDNAPSCPLSCLISIPGHSVRQTGRRTSAKIKAWT